MKRQPKNERRAAKTNKNTCEGDRFLIKGNLAFQSVNMRRSMTQLQIENYKSGMDSTGNKDFQ